MPRLRSNPLEDLPTGEYALSGTAAAPQYKKPVLVKKQRNKDSLFEPSSSSNHASTILSRESLSLSTGTGEQFAQQAQFLSHVYGGGRRGAALFALPVFAARQHLLQNDLQPVRALGAGEELGDKVILDHQHRPLRGLRRFGMQGTVAIGLPLGPQDIQRPADARNARRDGVVKARYLFAAAVVYGLPTTALPQRSPLIRPP